MGMKVYRGRRHEGLCLVDVRELGHPWSRLPFCFEGNTSFAWGLEIGSFHLAAAILSDLVGSEMALEHYEELRFKVVAGLSGDRWCLKQTEILAALPNLAAKLKQLGVRC